MASKKISAMVELETGEVASGDMVPLVDVSDTTGAATGTTKRVSVDNLISNGLGLGGHDCECGGAGE